MHETLAQFNLLITEIIIRGWQEFTNKSLLYWVYLLFPFFVFAELPRYIIPAFVVPLTNMFRGRRAREVAKKKAFLMNNYLVSIIIPARNEEKAIRETILSLKETNYPNKQIIVVDDGSTDATYAIAKPFADAGVIELVKSGTETGRGGKSFAMNLALKLCRGDYIMQVDADTSFDRNVIQEMLAPFADPKVGGVTGNIKVRNAGKNLVTKCQMCEYLLSISLWRNWASKIGVLLQMAGGLSMFRRDALEDVGGWDSELVEDADMTMKVRKLGLKTLFARDAVAFTSVPEGLNTLAAQRRRWERGFFRTFFRKHLNAMLPWRFHASNFIELVLQFFFTILCPYLYYAYFAALLVFKPWLIPLFIVASYVLYVGFFFLLLFVAISLSERRRQEWPYLIYIPILPLFNEFLRFVRAVSYIKELFRIGYEDPHLPRKTWEHTPRW